MSPRTVGAVMRKEFNHIVRARACSSPSSSLSLTSSSLCPDLEWRDVRTGIVDHDDPQSATLCALARRLLQGNGIPRKHTGVSAARTVALRRGVSSAGYARATRPKAFSHPGPHGPSHPNFSNMRHAISRPSSMPTTRDPAGVPGHNGMPAIEPPGGRIRSVQRGLRAGIHQPGHHRRIII
jgi:hypothetical protein